MIPEYRIGHLRRALGDRYEFEAFLGRGAFATVLLVRNRKLGRREALKVLQESYDGDHEFAKRFVEEARLVASLDHPSIVKVYDYGEVDGVLWYSMQYIGGPSLGAELDARKPLEHNEAVSLAVPLLDALAYSHGVGVVHRDVKPGNVMISMRGRPYLMDFGIAKVKDGGFKTATGSVLGTPAYISPEQAAGDAVDGRSDVYSFGVCLYQLATGSLPFPASDPIRMLLRRLSEDPAPPSLLKPSIDPRLEAIILKSLARSVDQRFQSAAAMRDALLDAFRHQVDVEAVRVTASVDEPAPLGAPPSVGAGPSAAPRELDIRSSDASEALTVSTQRRSASPAATAPEAATEREKTPHRARMLAALAVLALLVAAAWLWLGRGGVSGTAPTPPTAVATSSPQDPGSKAPAEESTAEVADRPGAGAADRPGADTRNPATTAGAEPAAAPENGGMPVRETEKTPAPARKPATTPPPPRPRQAVEQPAILDAPSIELPPDIAAECAGQEVIFVVSLKADGSLASGRALLSPSPTCSAAGRDHLERYRFRPGKDFEGLPVPSKLTLSLRFP